jgi:hypothetical protein
MFQREVLENIPTVISKNGEKIEVMYREGEFTGMCIYENVVISGNTKPIRQRVLLLTECDMGDIIEFIHKKSPMSSEDFGTVTMGIREDSLRRVTKFLSSL